MAFRLQTRRPTMRLLCLLSFVILGCESGTARSVKLTLPSSVATGFSATSPGLVVADLGNHVAAYVALCGQTPKNPVHLSQDLGFGCVGSRNGTTETARVWVQPLPSGWDAGAACAQASQDRSFYSELSLAPAAVDGGVDAGVLASDPEPGWAQGSDEGTWRRDGSPCGGVVNFELTLAMP